VKLQQPSEHPHGLPDRDFEQLFAADKPIVFAYHGYPRLIHRLAYRRPDHSNLHVRGYKGYIRIHEEGMPKICECKWPAQLTESHHK
jgi:phosphoketolase